MDRLISGFPHSEKTDISEQNIPVFDLMLRAVGGNIHAVAPFYKVTLPRMAPTTARPLAGIIRSLVNSILIFFMMTASLVFLWSIVSENIIKWVIMENFLKMLTNRINKGIATWNNN